MQDPHALTQLVLSSFSVATYPHQWNPWNAWASQTILLSTCLPLLCCAFFTQALFWWHKASGSMNFTNISQLEFLYTLIFSKPSILPFYSCGCICMPVIIFCRFCLHTTSTCCLLTCQRKKQTWCLFLLSGCGQWLILSNVGKKNWTLPDDVYEVILLLAVVLGSLKSCREQLPSHQLIHLWQQ